MAKKKSYRRTQPAKQAASPHRWWWLWGVAAVAVVLVVGGLTVLLSPNSGGAENGTPKVAVDQTVVDEGYQTFNSTVRTSFTLRNEGDGPLRILEEPQVKLVEGC